MARSRPSNTSDTGQHTHSNEAPAPSWHHLDVDAVLAALGVPDAGLTDTDAAARLQQFGPNELQERGAKSPWRIVWEQFTATMVLVLIAAAVLYAVVSGIADAVPIIAIVILFGLLGFVQEYRAERAMAALKRMAVPGVRVRRNGRVQDISARSGVGRHGAARSRQYPVLFLILVSLTASYPRSSAYPAYMPATMQQNGCMRT